MSNKTLITIGLIAGSTIGSYIPALWGDSTFSLSSIFFMFLGGLVGIWIGFRLGQS